MLLGLANDASSGIDERLEGLGVTRHLDDLGVGVLDRLLLPLLDALFENPHARDVLQQPGRALDATLVGNVQAHRLLGDDRVFHLDTHQRPGSGTQVSELLVLGRNGGDGRSGIMSGDGDDRNLAQPGLR